MKLKMASLIILIIGWGYPLLGQAQKNYKWNVSLTYSLEQHDKRLFDYPGQRLYIESQPEKWGTHWYGISISRNLLENEFSLFNAGLSYATEIQTFRRPFSPWAMFPDSVFTFLAHSTKDYKIKHLQIPLRYSFRLLWGFRMEVEVVPDFNFFKKPFEIPNVSYKKYDFEFYSISVNPYVQYRSNRLSISAGFRLYQYKKIDQVIFSKALLGKPPFDPWFDKEYETYNPLHLRVKVAYSFGKKEDWTERLK